jgi:hypothetical protein
MSPKARASGGETLDSPLRIEYYPSDDEHSRRKAFTQALKNPKKLFRDRKPAKKVVSISAEARQTSNASADSTISFLAIASEGMSTPIHEGLGGKRLPADQNLRSNLMSAGLLDDDEKCEEVDVAITPKRKQSQDHVDGTARSVSKSRTGADIMLDTSRIAAVNTEEDAINHSPLQAWFEANRHNPYPTREEWEWLASQSGRTIQQISTWFHHKRSRIKSLQRGGQTENAVIEWMDGVNADGSPQDSAISKDATPETPPSKVCEGCLSAGTLANVSVQRWSQASVVLNHLERNKEDIVKVAGNYFGSPSGTGQISEEQVTRKLDSASGKRDSAMTTTTIAPSVFSRSSTWTDHTSLTQHSDMLAGDGFVKRRLRDSRDSSMFSRPANSARSSLIGHPPIPFRTRSLGFNQNEDISPDSPTRVHSDRRAFSSKLNRSISSERRRPESIYEQPPAGEDSDDVFSFEVPKTPNEALAALTRPTHTTSAGKRAEGLAARKLNRASIASSSPGDDINVQRLTVPVEPSRILTLPSSGNAASATTTNSQPELVAPKAQSLPSELSKKPSSIIAYSANSSVGPAAPERKSSLRARAIHPGKKPRSTRSKESLISSQFGQSYFEPVLEAKEANSQSKYEEFALPVRSKNSVQFSHSTRVLDTLESETSLSVDDSDYDDASSGITDYSDETMKDERRTEGLGPVLQLVLANIRRDVVSKVIQELHGSQQKHGQTSKQNGTSTNYQRGGSSEVATPSSQHSKPGGKRPSRDRDSNTPDDRDDGDNDKRRKLHHAPASLLRSRFACPFYKHNSENHQRWRSCRGPGWDEVRRVK